MMKTNVAFAEINHADLAGISGGAITDADAKNIRELAEDFCPDTAKANAGTDYKSLTKDAATGLTSACLGEILKRDGQGAHDAAKKKIDESFKKFFP